MRYENIHQFVSPVLSITILDQSTSNFDSVTEEARMLAVVRDPNTNLTHPNVISIPTQRIPEVLFHAILESANIDNECGLTTFYEGKAIDNVSESGHHPVIYAVESILSRKLGMAEVVESDALQFQAAVRVVTIGKSNHVYSTSEIQCEHIAMANIKVIVTQGAKLFPRRSSSYSHILWITLSQFLETVRERNPLILDLNPLEYCIHGLCITTAYDMLTYRLAQVHPENCTV
jgi:hypothetical protein